MSQPSIDAIKQENPDWQSFTIFDSEGKILLSTVAESGLSTKEYLDSYKDFNETIKNGINYDGVFFHVHRFYEGALYGRADPEQNITNGFALLRFDREGKSSINLIFKFDLPAVTARLIPAAYKYMESVKNSFE